MSVKIMYFVHGTTTDNEQKLSSGWKDVELSELGITQGKELKEKIKEFWGEDLKFDVIISSDLKRAVDSADIAWPENEITKIQDERIRECNYGDLNGKPSEIVEPMQEDIANRFPNGESYEDVEIRIKSFLEYLRKNFDGKHVALVAHKAPQIVLEHLLNGISYEEAFKNDWRKRKAWQPGWAYELE